MPVIVRVKLNQKHLLLNSNLSHSLSFKIYSESDHLLSVKLNICIFGLTSAQLSLPVGKLQGQMTWWWLRTSEAVNVEGEGTFSQELPRLPEPTNIGMAVGPGT